MKQSLQLRLGQHLTMTPQLQQAIRLLQLSALELQAEVQDALDSNVMLEEGEEGTPANGEDGAEPTPAPAEATGDGDDPEGPPSREDASVDMHDADMPDDLPVDSAWDDLYDLGSQPSGAAADDVDTPFEGRRNGGGSLREHLDWQLMLTPLSERDRTIATAILDSIDEDGYLRADTGELCAAVGGDPLPEPEEVEAVLRHVQNFDPPGVGARDLRECLLIQLRQLPDGHPRRDEAMTLVAEHLDLLGGRDFRQLMRRMGLDQGRLQEVIALIQRLDPRPGGRVGDNEPEFVVPDVFVRRREGAWHVELNPEAMPRVRINPYYAGLVRRADSSADNTTLKAHLQEARWFLKSLQSRSETLLKVASAIVERQRGFLEHGEEAMKPMVLHDVAEAVDMHESTISRVTTRKYMHTPRGIFELKYFFSSHVATEGGGEASSTAIRALIKKLVAAENPAKPLSDSRIAQVLSDEGIKVARRTVAKYREAMAIPPSNERKRLA